MIKEYFQIKDNCKIIDTLFLDKNVWWNDYFKQLESEITAINNNYIKDLFKNDLKDIKHFKVDSSPFN